MQILSSKPTSIFSRLGLVIFSIFVLITPGFGAWAPPVEESNLEERQNLAAGGGAGVVTAAVTQAATTTWACSKITTGATTTTEWVLFTQTFNTSIGTWVYPTALSGSIGLGTTIRGTVG